MGITTYSQQITTPQIGDSRTSRNYLFITPSINQENNNRAQKGLMANTHLISMNRSYRQGFMTGMNPFMA